MRIRRDGRIHEVIYETETEYIVSVPFTYSEKPCVRNQTLWWDKKLCTKIEDNDTMSTKEALAKLNTGIQKTNDGHVYLLGSEYVAGMEMLHEVRDWLKDFVERVDDVKLGDG